MPNSSILIFMNGLSFNIVTKQIAYVPFEIWEIFGSLEVI